MKRIDRDKVAPGVAAVGTLAVGGLAFALSFTALSELAAANGVAQAEMVPLVVDSRRGLWSASGWPHNAHSSLRSGINAAPRGPTYGVCHDN